MASIYTYNKKVNSNQLLIDITNGLPGYPAPSVSPEFINYNLSSYDIDIYYSSALSPTDETKLDNIINAYVYVDISGDGSFNTLNTINIVNLSGATFGGVSQFDSVSATTYYGDGSNLTGITVNDTYVTGFTFNNNQISIEQNNGTPTLSVNLNYLTGVTIGNLLVTGTSQFNSVSATTYYGDGSNLSGISTNDTYVTGFTFNNNQISIEQNNGTPTLSVNISGITQVNNLITVGGSGNVMFTSIKQACDSITGATSANTYTVRVYAGIYDEQPFTIPSWVSVVGDSSTSTIINAVDSSKTLIHLSDQSAIFDCQIQGCTDTGVSAVVYSSSTTPQSSAISYVENVRFGSNYTHAKVVAYGGANIIMQCSNVKYGGYPFTLGFHATNNGSGIGRMQLRNVTSTNGGVVTTSGLTFAKADNSGCGFIVNGCLLTKSIGSPAGVGFHVENGGFLRLTSVNFQRWDTAIYAPQVGSAPSIDAIALNFENCNKDVNIIHSGTTGKIQGADSYLKTLINDNAPIYRVGTDVKKIIVAKKGGDFSSVKSAVDFLISSGNTSSSNRYIISVGPGEFTEDEIDLTTTPFVSIVGSNIQATVIKPISNSQHIIKLGVNNEVSFLTLSGAGAGYSALYAYDIGDYAQAHKLSFYDCDTSVHLESVTTDSYFYGEYLDINGDYSFGVKTIANNGYVSYANLENYYNYPSGNGIQISNYASGSGATLSILSSSIFGSSTTGETAIYIQDYATLDATSLDIDSSYYSIRNGNTGGPCIIDLDAVSITNSIYYDVSIEQPLTSGTILGSMSHELIFTNSDLVSWLLLDSGDGEIDITNRLSVTFTDGTHTDLSTILIKGATMGLISGGTITHTSGLTINVSSGYGYLEKSPNTTIIKRFDWVSQNITLPGDSNLYIYFNENGILSYSGTKPDSINNIILGRVITNSIVEIIDSTPLNAEHTSNRYSNIFTEAIGPIYAEGSIVTENATPFHLDVTSGEYYFSTNEIKPSGGTDITFVQYYRNGLTGWTTSATTIITNSQFDNNGTLSGLSASYYTKHTLYVIGEGSYEKYLLVIGQNQYASLVEAEDGLLPTPPPYFSDSIVQIANIYVQQGTSGITQVEDVRPVIGFKAGGVNASSTHGNLLGLSADDHTQYLLVSGDRAMSGNLDMGSNNITNIGTLNNVTIQTHASRHLPNGSDPLTTATPVSISNTNSEGIANSFSRSDHQHAHGIQSGGTLHSVATTSVSGFMSSSDKTYLDSVPSILNQKANLSGATFTGLIKSPSISATTITGGVFYGDGSNLSGISASDNYVTGGTYTKSSGTLTLRRQNGNVTITGLTDTFVTGMTYSANVLTLRRNQGESNLTATIGLRVKSGNVAGATFTGTPKKVTVTFTTPYANTNYSIAISSDTNRTFTWESKTTNGFVINSNANTAIGGSVDWITTQYGES